MTRILIIGFGKVGSHLYKVLNSRKNIFSIFTIKNSRSKIDKRALENSDIIFLCTQDDKIRSGVIGIIKTGIDLRGKIAAHTSGALSSDELTELKKMGCITASFHPVQTFHSRARLKKTLKPTDNLFENIYIAIEGSLPAVGALKRIAKQIGSKPILIDKGFKTLHHICCVISSGFVAANLSVVKDIYTRKNGFKKGSFLDIYRPLIQKTVSNAVLSGIEKSVTGPIIRNDIKTINNHLKALKALKDNEIIDYYLLMSLKILKIASGIGSGSKMRYRKVEELLKRERA